MNKVMIYNRVSPHVKAQLREKFDTLEFQDEYLDNPTFVNRLKETHGIIGLELKVNKELLDLAPNLKIVSNVSAGFDNLDLNELTKRNIMATNTPNVLNETVADAVTGMVLAAARRIPELDQYVKNGQWNQYLRPEQFGIDVHHKTVGIIGMGSIGAVIAKRLRFGFDMNILYHNRSRKQQVEETYQAIYCDLEELLQQSDFIVLIVPATKETEKMIGEKEFKMMKKSAIFINASRGKNVDEKALYHALQTKEILAAATDVYETEPVQRNHPLLTLKNLITLPHLGAATIENERSMSELAAENLIAGLKGERPRNLINTEVHFSAEPY